MKAILSKNLSKYESYFSFKPEYFAAIIMYQWKILANNIARKSNEATIKTLPRKGNPIKLPLNETKMIGMVLENWKAFETKVK